MTKIMLVEDDNGLREIYEARLAAEGFDIVAAVDGEEALAMAAKEKPDLVISDVMMPKISGFEMLDILRNTEGLKNVKIIMLTALGQAEDKTRADALGADRYLVKSQVTLEDIVKATHDLLDTPAPVAATPVAAADAAPAAAPAPVVPAAPAVQTIALASVPNTDDTPATPPPAAPTPPIAPPTEPVSVDPAPVTDATPPPAPAPVAEPAPPVVEAPAPEPAPAPVQSPAPGSITAVEIPPEATTEPAPEPTPAPVAAEPAATPVPPSVLDTTDYAPKSLAEEEAIMQAQIDNFVSTPAGSPSDTAAPAVVETPVPEATTEPATSVEPAPTLPVAPAEPAPQETTFSPMSPQSNEEPAESAPGESENPGSVPVAHKKVIQPINTSPKPDINTLLALEEAKEAAYQSTPAPVAADAPPASAATAAPVIDGAPAQTPPPTSTTPASTDPNNIAL